MDSKNSDKPNLTLTINENKNNKKNNRNRNNKKINIRPKTNNLKYKKITRKNIGLLYFSEGINRIRNNKKLLNAIIRIQQSYRKQVKKVFVFNQQYGFIYNCVLNMTQNIKDIFVKGIIFQNEYHEYMITIDEIFQQFKEIPRPLTIKNYYLLGSDKLNKNLSDVKEGIRNLCKLCGIVNIKQLAEIMFDIDVSFLFRSKQLIPYHNLISFYNKLFIPTNCAIYDLDMIKNKDQTKLRKPNQKIINKKSINSKQSKYRNNKSKNKQLIIYENKKNKKDQGDYLNDIRQLRYVILKNNFSPFFTKLNKKNISLIEHIHGAKMYLLVVNHKLRINSAMVMRGYFREDLLNISRWGGILGKKNSELKQELGNIKISSGFKFGYIEQLSVRDFVLHSTQILIEKCLDSYNRVINLTQKTISSIVRTFINSNIEKQRDILTLFLLMKDNDNIQYLAYMMYDMISNESNLLKPQPIAEQVFSSLHYSIQKLFKVAMTRINKYTNSFYKFNENNLPYDKRICLLKANKYVKVKAMEKLREINSKGNGDNVAKPQQYLDGLLKIPFGIYKQEKIINFLNNFQKKLEMYVIQYISVTRQLTKNRFSVILYELCQTYSLTKNIKSCQINKFMCEFNNNKNKLIESCILDFQNQLSEQNISNIDKFLNKLKVTDIKMLIKKINSQIPKENKIILSRNKKNLVDSIIQLMNIYLNYDNYNNSNNHNNINDDSIKNKSIKNNSIKNKSIKNNSKKIINCIVSRKSNKLIKSSKSNNLSKSIKLEQLDNYKNIYDKIINLIIELPEYKLYSINKYHLNTLNKFESYKDTWKNYKKNSKTYLEKIDDVLNKSVYGQKEAKLQIKRIIAQWINGENKGYCFGFEGPPGVGKTSLAKKGIAHCLVDSKGNARPFSFIALGGSSNGTTLEGHSYTYVGSTWGKIVDILMESQCMNPIIFIDELDKVSRTEHGREIIGILTHLTDASQNEEFRDKYFGGIKLDLSKVLFIFSYNDYSLLDPILADRIQRIRFKHLSCRDKIHIANKHLIPEILNAVGFSHDEVEFPNSVIEFIIKHYTYEGGVRRLKEKLFEIIRELNLRYLLNDKRIFKSGKKSPIHRYNNSNGINNVNKSSMFKVTIKIVEEIFSDKPKIIHKKIADKPYIGLVNGLFATAMGVGGLNIVEAFKTPSDTKLSLKLTGKQGEVMKESMQVAKTVAWNLLPNSVKKNICKKMKDSGNFGLHIHCPEASTPKEGPSAGAAITLAIVSVLCEIPVLNTVAMTGEIDLNGTVYAIGGLDAKIEGAINAGITKILCPEANREDVKIIRKKENSPITNNVDIVFIKDIWQVLDICLIDNDIQFERYLVK